MFQNSQSQNAHESPGPHDERGIPQVGRNRKGNKYVVLLALGLGITIAIGLGANAVLDKLRHRGEGRDKPQMAQRGLPDLTRDAFDTKNAPPPPPGKAETPAGPTGLTAEQKAAMDLAERRKRAPVRVLSAQQAGAAGNAGGATLAAGPTTGGARASNSLSSALSATRTAESLASQLTDPDLTLTQGSFLDCTLVTAISSQMPGMTSCVLNRNVYSTNGRVLLLERGSRIVGQYQSGQLRQGLDRIFVLWTRAETPNGVIVNLDSPSTDALGRSGMEGHINHHFWLRFGAAMLVSVVDDAAQIAANGGRGNSDGNVYNFGSTSSAARDAASIIVESTVNIPPTLDRAQGGHIGIFVARDLYFGSVYSLAPRDVAP